MSLRRVTGIGLGLLALSVPMFAFAVASDGASMRGDAYPTQVRRQLHYRRASDGVRSSAPQGSGTSWGSAGSGGSGGSWGSSSGGKKPNATTGAETGFSIAVAGNTAVVAAPGTSDDAGLASIWERSGRHWKKAATLADPRGDAGDWYAWAVAISSTKSGTYVAVGGNDTNTQQDAIYIYKGSGTHWHREAKLLDPGINSQDMYGDSIAISPSVLVVGASCYNANMGEIWIYSRLITGWHLRNMYIDPGNSHDDNFGQAVGVSGRNVLIGAIDKVYVYTRTSRNRWRRSATIANPGRAKDNFGASLAVFGSTVLIGAPTGVPGGIISSPVGAGAAYVFQKSGMSWRKRQKLTAPGGLGQKFGFSVSFDGRAMLIGVPTYLSHGTINCGAAFLATRSGGKWVVHHSIVKIQNENCYTNDGIGWSVAISGNTGIIGSPWTNSNQGVAYFAPLS
jgi:FG-GAP repeat